MVLCVSEACTNSIQHSRSSDDIEIEIAFEDDWLSVRVQDHGVGFATGSFDPHACPDPTALGGRGLFLIASVMDETEIACDGGTTVRMRRRVAVTSATHRRTADARESTSAGRVVALDQEQRAFSLLEDFADGFMALDWEWHVIYANPAAISLLRAPKDLRLNGPVWPLFKEEGTDFEMRLRLAMEQGIPSHFEGCFQPYPTWYDLRLYPNASGVCIYFTEINERKRIERERDELLDQAEQQRARLQAVLDALPVAVGITDADGRVIALNPMVSRLWAGRAPMPQGPSDYGRYRGWWPETGEPLEPGDWTTARVLRSGEPILGELIEIECFDGTRAVVISSSVPIKDPTGRLVGAVGVTDDVTLHHRSRRLSEALNSINSLIHSTLRMEDIMRRVVREAAVALDADAVAIELREGDASPVRYAEGLPPDHLGRSLTGGSTISRAVAETGRRLVLPDTAADPLLAESEIAEFRSLMAVPLVVKDDTFGVLVFLDRPPCAFDQPAIDFAETLSASVSLALENARLYDDIATRERLGSALNTINASVASVLDYEEILHRVIALTGSEMGAHSGAICLLEDGAWVPSTVWQQSADVIGVRIPRESVPYADAAVETRAVVTVDDCERDARVDRELQMSWGVTAVMVAPLVVRNVVVAGLFVNFHDGPHHFTAAEQDFLDKAAAAISGALARAENYASEHRIAQTLQDALLALPEHIPGLRFAHRYHSAAEVARVGGDFYDAFELDHGLLGITMGDMSGKGLDAAVLTSLVKHTIRAHAVERGKTPAEILSMANTVLCLQSDPERFATVFFAILDRHTGRLVYCNAGHPAPAVVCGGRSAAMLPANSPLVGAFLDAPYTDAETHLETEDVLLLYTDGLTEARRGRALFGEARLEELLGRCRGLDPHDLVQSVADAVDSFAEGRLDDDLALLAIQRVAHPDAAPRRLRVDSGGLRGLADG